MSLLGRGHLALQSSPPPGPTLTDTEALLLGALLHHELADYCDRFGGADVVDPCALDDMRDQLRDRWLQRITDGGGAEGRRLRGVGRGER